MRMQMTNTSSPRYADWLSRSILSGFAATAVMALTLLLGYTLALFLAAMTTQPTASGQEMNAWFRGLTANPLVDFTQNTLYFALALHFTIGIFWAGVYGYFVQPRLRGPGWQRGLLFSLVPWLLSVTVFFPVVGAGFMGMALGAGPLPVIGNLIAHLAYGVTLGLVFSTVGDVILTESGRGTAHESRDLEHSEAMGAGGVIIGAAIGTVSAIILNVVSINVSGTTPLGMPPLALVLTGAAIGGAMGELVGSFVGLPVHRRHEG